MNTHDLDARIRRIEKAIEGGYRTGKLPLRKTPAALAPPPVCFADAVAEVTAGRPFPPGMPAEQEERACFAAVLQALARGKPAPALAWARLSEERRNMAEYYAPALWQVLENPCPPSPPSN